jgi:N-methylhydantoinase B
VLRINGEKVDPKKQYVLSRGDTVILSTPGGGGHGDPEKRDRLARERDIKAGYTSG